MSKSTYKVKKRRQYEKVLLAQLNFTGPEFIFANFWEFLTKQSGTQV
jgi:hypothetical protein